MNVDCAPLYSEQDLSCRVVVKKYILIPLLPCVFGCALLCVTDVCENRSESVYTGLVLSSPYLMVSMRLCVDSYW